MNNRPSASRAPERPGRSLRLGRAFSLLELLLVMAIIMILAALLLPTLSDAKRRAYRTQCLSNLKQIGLAFHSFAHEHDNRFPMQVSTNAGGSMEFLRAANNFPGDFYFAFRHFQPLARELDTPKLLVCPADTRGASLTWNDLRNENVSYFVGASADYYRPDSILIGDRNLVRIGPGSGSIIIISSQTYVEWTTELHNRTGNLLFADGRVESFNNTQVQTIARQTPGTITILPPSTPGTVVVSPPASSGASGQSASSSSQSGGLLSALEQILQTKSTITSNTTKTTTTPSGTRPAGSQTTNPAGSGNLTVSSVRPVKVTPPGPDAPVSMPQETLSDTNVPKTNAAISISSPNVASAPIQDPEITAGDPWPVHLAHTIAQWSQRFTYLLLLLLLLTCVTLEVLRRRRARKKKTLALEKLLE